MSQPAMSRAVFAPMAKQMPCAGRIGGVHADHLAFRAHQRAARVSRIERRVRLDHVVDEAPGLRAHGAAQRAHDPGGDRMLETIGAADGDRDLAHFHLRGIAQDAPVVHRRLDADHGEVGIGVVAHEAGARFAPVGQAHRERARLRGDVAVGEGVAVGRDGEARAGSRALSLAMHRDVDDGRADLADGGGDRRRIGIEEIGIAHGRDMGDAGANRNPRPR